MEYFGSNCGGSRDLRGVQGTHLHLWCNSKLSHLTILLWCTKKELKEKNTKDRRTRSDLVEYENA